MSPEAPAATEVAATVREKLALARQCVERAQAYQKSYADRRRRPVEFSIGQQVLLSTTHLPVPAGRKLGQRWMGPFAVVRRVGAVAYELHLPPSLAVHPVFHVSLLRAYDARGEHRRTLPPDPIQVAGHSEHVVARVLRHRRRGRGL